MLQFLFCLIATLSITLNTFAFFTSSLRPGAFWWGEKLCGDSPFARLWEVLILWMLIFGPAVLCITVINYSL